MKVRDLPAAVRDATAKHGGVVGLGRKMVQVFRDHGLSGSLARVRKQLRVSSGARAIELAPSERAFEPTPAQLAEPPDGTIGVMAHVFYVDLADELARHVAHIPWPFTLLVSTPWEEHREVLERKLAAVRNARVVVRVVPNRGRDLAPMFVEFAREIRQLDYVCHVHTKKSLHSGADQIGWRQHLYGALLGSEARVRAVFAQFREDPRVGIIYPAPHEIIPYWAHTWLANAAVARDLLPRIGVPMHESQYIDFPAGSMFWARVRALQPIWDLRLRYEDFPQESGQTDGTLQHTLERALVLAARAAGMTDRVLAEGSAHHRFLQRNHRNMYQYFGASAPDRIAAAAAPATLVSFDVFDTLLVRPFGDPDSVFRWLEDRIPRERGVTGFMAKRKAAEGALRARCPPGKDVTLAEIYRELERRERLAPGVADALLALEVDAERALLHPREPIVEAARALARAGRRVVLVSDTYLERHHLDDLLAAAGIDFAEAVYLSSQIGRRKDRGDIWEHLLAAERIEPGQLTHVGDNERSDMHILVERRFPGGLVHVMRPLTLLEATDEGRALLRGRRPDRWQDDLVVGLLANRAARILDRDPQRLNSGGRLIGSPGDLGYFMLGPVMLEFLAWLVRSAERDRVRTLQFLSREGYVLEQAYHRLAKHPAIAGTVPTAGYLYASRRAAAVAAMRTFEDVEALLAAEYEGTIGDLLRSRLGPDEAASVERSIGPLAPRQRVTLPSDRGRVLDVLRPAAAPLLARAALERECYLAYLEPRLTPDAAVVDVGYRGSIQRSLMRLLGRPLRGYYMATKARARAVQDEGGSITACFGEFLDDLTARDPLFRYQLLLEAVLTAPEGQVVRFERVGAEIRPVMKPPGRAQRRFAELSQVHEGIYAFVADAVRHLGRDALHLQLDRELLQRPLQLVAERTWRIAELEDLLSVEDDFSGHGEIPVVEFYASRLEPTGDPDRAGVTSTERPRGTGTERKT